MKVKNIIVPCDGTWNGLPTTTNVRRLAKAITDIHPRIGISNVQPPNGFFEGVGMGGSAAEFVFNGAFASDLDNKIKEAYKFIAVNYDTNCTNRVWLFGFSRGAYTVRSVAGMIRNCGIIVTGADAADRAIDQAYKIYRNNGKECHPDGPIATEFRTSLSHDGSDASIVFMGLWDTVGAHGLPFYSLDSGISYREFFDLFVSSNVNYTYQALATHENLANFEPCRIFKRPDATNVVVERWFPGVHIDVGGFVLDNPISDTTLNWMINNINNANIPGTANPALGALVSPVDVSPFPANLLVRAARGLVGLTRRITRVVFSDRVIPGLNANILYDVGNWSRIAHSSDYSSSAYTNFRSLFISRGLEPPPEFP